MKTKSIKPRVKKIPQRTCLACHKVKDKQELIRLVCSGGSVEVDISGNKTGRGAYLCPTKECWEAGVKGHRLEHALRVTLTPGNREQLIHWEQNRSQGVD